LEAKVAVERYRPEFQDAIPLTGLNLPPGFEFPATDLPAGWNEVPIKVNVAADVPPDIYSVVLRGAAQVPFSPDPAVTDKSKVRVADPASPLTVKVVAPQENPESPELLERIAKTRLHRCLGWPGSLGAGAAGTSARLRTQVKIIRSRPPFRFSCEIL
jgi:hypothetical protein